MAAPTCLIDVFPVTSFPLTFAIFNGHSNVKLNVVFLSKLSSEIKAAFKTQVRTGICNFGMHLIHLYAVDCNKFSCLDKTCIVSFCTVTLFTLF